MIVALRLKDYIKPCYLDDFGWVELNDEEDNSAIQYAEILEKKSKERGYQDKHGFEGNGLDITIKGMRGEVAYAKKLNKPYEFRPDNFKGPDIGWRTQIRTAGKLHHDLIVRGCDNPDHMYVLVVMDIIRPRLMNIMGWMPGLEAKTYPKKTYDNRPEEHFVPQKELYRFISWRKK